MGQIYGGQRAVRGMGKAHAPDAAHAVKAKPDLRPELEALRKTIATACSAEGAYFQDELSACEQKLNRLFAQSGEDPITEGSELGNEIARACGDMVRLATRDEEDASLPQPARDAANTAGDVAAAMRFYLGFEKSDADTLNAELVARRGSVHESRNATPASLGPQPVQGEQELVPDARAYAEPGAQQEPHAPEASRPLRNPQTLQRFQQLLRQIQTATDRLGNQGHNLFAKELLKQAGREGWVDRVSYGSSIYDSWSGAAKHLTRGQGERRHDGLSLSGIKAQARAQGWRESNSYGSTDDDDLQSAIKYLNAAPSAPFKREIRTHQSAIVKLAESEGWSPDYRERRDMTDVETYEAARAYLEARLAA